VIRLRKGIIMKLRKLELLDIAKISDSYEFIYGAYGTTIFSKKYYKLKFTADLPGWWLTEILGQMRKKGVFFEDILKDKTTDLGMGCIICMPFTEEDKELYGTNITDWQKQTNAAVKKQRELSAEYKRENGAMDLTKYSNW